MYRLRSHWASAMSCSAMSIYSTIAVSVLLRAVAFEEFQRFSAVFSFGFAIKFEFKHTAKNPVLVHGPTLEFLVVSATKLAKNSKVDVPGHQPKRLMSMKFII